MLTLQQEKTQLGQLLNNNGVKVFNDYKEMMVLEPVKGMINLICFKSEELRIKKIDLFNNLIDHLFSKITKNHTYQFHLSHYTFEWFNFYLHKAISENPFHDILGKVMTELNGYNTNLSQYMTPSNFSLNGINLINSDKIKDSGVVSDICCGTGSMILSLLKHSEYNNKIIINDIDEAVLKVCVIQIYLTKTIHLPKNKYVLYVYNSNLIKEYNEGKELYLVLKLDINYSS